MKKKFLVVVDMQNDFVTGSLGTDEAKAIVPKVVDLIDIHARMGSHIIFTRDTHSIDYLNTQEGKKLPVKHCIRGTDGHNLVPEIREKLNQLKGEIAFSDFEYIDKGQFGSYDLISTISPFVKNNEVTEMQFCGLCTDICVVSNVLMAKAAFPELPISVHKNKCAGVTPEKHDAAILTMESCQVEMVD